MHCSWTWPWQSVWDSVRTHPGPCAQPGWGSGPPSQPPQPGPADSHTQPPPQQGLSLIQAIWTQTQTTSIWNHTIKSHYYCSVHQWRRGSGTWPLNGDLTFSVRFPQSKSDLLNSLDWTIFSRKNVNAPKLLYKATCCFICGEVAFTKISPRVKRKHCNAEFVSCWRSNLAVLIVALNWPEKIRKHYYTYQCCNITGLYCDRDKEGMVWYEVRWNNLLANAKHLYKKKNYIWENCWMQQTLLNHLYVSLGKNLSQSEVIWFLHEPHCVSDMAIGLSPVIRLTLVLQL